MLNDSMLKKELWNVKKIKELKTAIKEKYIKISNPTTEKIEIQ